MTKEWNPETVFDVLGCEVAREILALASARPVSAADLADHCGVSEPTVYRRIQALQEYDMLDEELEIDGDGHHYRRFETTLDEARVRVREGDLDVDLDVERDYADKFAEFWRDIGAAGATPSARPPRREGSASNATGG